MAAQYFISSEILALTAIMSIVGVMIAGAYWAQTNRGELRAAIGPAMKGVAVAAGVSLFLLSYPIWFGFAGPHHYSGPTWSAGPRYNAHLSEFVAPTPLQLIHPMLGTQGATLWRESSLLEGAYLGIGLLALTAVLVWVGRRSRRVGLAAALGAISALLSFGSYALVNGTGAPLPFLALTKIPMLADVIPVRFSVAIAACVAAVLAFALDSIHRGGPRRPPQHASVSTSANWRANAWLAAVCVVVGVTWLPAWPFSSQPVQKLPSAVVRTLPSGDPLVLTYPYPLAADDSAMVWQAEAGFPFRLSGAYAMVPQNDGRPGVQAPLLQPEAVQEYFAAEETGSRSSYPRPAPNVDMVAQVRDFVVRQHVDAVVVDVSSANAARVRHLFSAALGSPRLTSDGFELWVIGGRRQT